MDVKGAYTTIEDFLFTYKECKIISSFSNSENNQWSFEANRTIKIPDYQREFRWKEKQLEELFNDINKGNCYLGQIAVSHKRGSNIYGIVDGQQRIISIIILLTVLCRQFYVYNDHINLKKYELHKSENNDAYADREHRTPVSRLHFDANCFSDFQEFISQVYKETNKETKEFEDNNFCFNGDDFYDQKERYIKACSDLNTVLMNNLDTKNSIPDKLTHVKEIIDNIFKTRISVVIFEGNSVGESEKVFLDINEKGLRLDNEDILKAYYFQSITSDTGDLALNTWTNLKKNYFGLQSALNNSNKISLDTWMNFILQISLFTDQDNEYDFEKFDNDLRYGGSEKKHICQLFIDSELQVAFERSVTFLQTLKNLLEYTADSSFYKTYLTDEDSTTRQVFRLLIENMCKADMKLVFMVLAKIWWIRKNEEKNLTLDDIIQVFSFYIVSNVSGLKKEKNIISRSFIATKNILKAYEELITLEKVLLENSSEKSITLKRDQKKAEYLSYNIQMFYNIFEFNKVQNCWKIKTSNQDFIEKYQTQRCQYAKDHFLIQNGNTIKLLDGSDFKITKSMIGLRTRAYNFVYHKDIYENEDFVSRLNKIYDSVSEKPLDKKYGPYEIAYFEYISSQFREFYINEGVLPTWKEAVEIYRKFASKDFPKIISFILLERSPTWNRMIGEHFLNQILR